MTETQREVAREVKAVLYSNVAFVMEHVCSKCVYRQTCPHNYDCEYCHNRHYWNEVEDKVDRFVSAL